MISKKNKGRWGRVIWLVSSLLLLALGQWGITVKSLAVGGMALSVLGVVLLWLGIRASSQGDKAVKALAWLRRPSTKRHTDKPSVIFRWLVMSPLGLSVRNGVKCWLEAVVRWWRGAPRYRLGMLACGLTIIAVSHILFHSFQHGVQDLAGKALGICLILVAARGPVVGAVWRGAKRRGPSLVWLLPAVVAAVLLAKAAMSMFGKRMVATGVVEILLGLAIVAFFFRGNMEERTERALPAKGRKYNLPLWIATIFIALVFALICSSGNPAKAVWLVPVLVFLVYLGGGQLTGEGEKGDGALGKRDLLALAIILPLAAFLRLYKLEYVPPGLSLDEGVQADFALFFSRNYPVAFFVNICTLIGTNAWAYLLGQLLKLFDPSVAVFRLPTVLGGLLMTVYLYLLARELFGRTVAVIAAALLAFSFWPVFFSRVAYHWIMGPALLVCGAYHMLRGIRQGRVLHFVIAGAFLGLGPYFYPIAFGIPGPIACYIIYLFIRDRSLLRRRWNGVLAMFLSYCLSAYPALYAFLNGLTGVNRVLSLGRISGSLDGLVQPIDIISSHFIQYPLLFFSRSTGHAYHNLPGEPLLDPLSAALFAVGALVVLLHWRKEKMFLLAIWMVFGFYPGIFSLGAGLQIPRIGLLMALVSLMCGLVLGRGYLMLRERFATPSARRLLLCGLMIVLGIIAVSNSRKYFHRWANHLHALESFYHTESRVGRFARDLVMEVRQADREIGVIGHVSDYWKASTTMGIYWSEVDVAWLYWKGINSLLELGSADKNTVIVVEPLYRELAAWMRQFYPRADYRELPDPRPGELKNFNDTYHEEITACAFIISAKDYSDARGLELEEYFRPGFLEKKEEKVVRRVDYRAGAAAGSALWRGSILAPDQGNYTFSLSGSGDCDYLVRLDGRQEFAGSLAGGSKEHKLRLVGGFHSLEVRLLRGSRFRLTIQAALRTGKTVELLWQNMFRGDHTQGLLGKYYAHGSGFKGTPVFSRIDPQIQMRWHKYVYPAIPGYPFEVEWRGKLIVSQSGWYSFETSMEDSGIVFVDGEKVFACQYWKQKLMSRRVYLKAGEHVLRVLDYGTGRNLANVLYWSRDGGERQVVSFKHLRPY